jgi:hypothetical protein
MFGPSSGLSPKARNSGDASCRRHRGVRLRTTRILYVAPIPLPATVINRSQDKNTSNDRNRCCRFTISRHSGTPQQPRKCIPHCKRRDYCMLPRHFSKVPFVSKVPFAGALWRCQGLSSQYRAPGHLEGARAKRKQLRLLCSLPPRIAA